MLRSLKDHSSPWIDYRELAFLLPSHTCIKELQFPSLVQLYPSTWPLLYIKFNFSCIRSHNLYFTLLYFTLVRHMTHLVASGPVPITSPSVNQVRFRFCRCPSIWSGSGSGSVAVYQPGSGFAGPVLVPSLSVSPVIVLSGPTRSS